MSTAAVKLPHMMIVIGSSYEIGEFDEPTYLVYVDGFEHDGDENHAICRIWRSSYSRWVVNLKGPEPDDKMYILTRETRAIPVNLFQQEIDFVRHSDRKSIPEELQEFVMFFSHIENVNGQARKGKLHISPNSMSIRREVGTILRRKLAEKMALGRGSFGKIKLTFPFLKDDVIKAFGGNVRRSGKSTAISFEKPGDLDTLCGAKWDLKILDNQFLACIVFLRITTCNSQYFYAEFRVGKLRYFNIDEYRYAGDKIFKKYAK